MHDHGIGILPAQLDPEYSRGHPLLAYAYTAIFYKLFGDSLAVGHASAILTAVLVLIALFQTGRRIFGDVAALCAVALLMAQPIFFSMAGAIYPEMLLALFFVWGIYGMTTRRWGQFAVASSLAVLVKEPGLILPAAAGVYWLIDLLREKRFWKRATWLQLLSVLTPLFTYGAFLLIQKVQNGWYFFPYHLQLIHYESSYIWGITRRLLDELFLQQGRVWLTLPLITGLLLYRKIFQGSQVRRYLLAFGLVLFFTLAFAAVNFYLARYWLFVYPSFVLLGVYCWFSIGRYFLQQRGFYLAVGGMTLAMAFALQKMDGKRFADNYDMAYVHTVKTVQECVDWMQTQPEIMADTPRVTFPIFEALRDPRNGYVKSPIPHHTNWDVPTRFFIVYLLPTDHMAEHLKAAKEIKQFKLYDNTIHVLDTHAPQNP